MFYKVLYEGVFDEHYINRLSILNAASIKYKMKLLETAKDVNDIQNDEKAQTLAQIKVKKSDLYRAENLLANLPHSQYDEVFFNEYKAYEEKNERIHSRKVTVLAVLFLAISISENEIYRSVIFLLILLYSIYLVAISMRALKVSKVWLERLDPIFFVILGFISLGISIDYLAKIIIV